MNTIIGDYVRSHLRANKRSTMFIFTAILIAATLLCASGFLLYSQWLNEVDTTVKDRGNWHARLGQPVPAEQLKYIQLHPQVDEVYLESQHKSLQLEGTKRPYLNLVQLSVDAWENSPRTGRLLEGRIPKKKGEIIVSKLFFAENPQYQIGDSLQLPIGQRMLDGRQVADYAPRLQGEIFQPAGEQAFIITGTINESSVSSYPCYSAYGFADMQTASPKELFNVSVRLRNISDAYETAPQLAGNIGQKPNAAGSYAITYNTPLLALYGLKGPGVHGGIALTSGYALSALLTMGLVMLLFTILIYNAFTATTASQIRQLGILKSVGATPKQIRRIVLYEALGLACIAIPLGLLLGYAGMAVIIKAIDALLADSANNHLRIEFSWPIVGIAGAASFATVLLSAWTPARKLARLLPIEAIRNVPATRKAGKTREYRWLHNRLSAEGGLAFSAFAANKKAYRTTIISLTLFITLIVGFQSFAVIWIADQKLALAQKQYTFELSMTTVAQPDPAMMKQLSGLSGVQQQVVYRGAEHSLKWDKQRIHPAFAAAGGFQDSYYPGNSGGSFPTNLLQEDGQPRIFLELKGLDSASFAAYCARIGVDAALFADQTQSKAIVVNRTSGNIPSFIEKYNIPETEYLQLAAGDSMIVEEDHFPDQPRTGGQYKLTIGAVTGQYPALDQHHYPLDLVVIVPMDTYESIVQKLSMERALDYQSITFKMNIPREQLAVARQQAGEILNQYLPPEDWSITTLLSREESNRDAIRSIELLVGGFAILLGCIGITGAFSTVSGNLSARRREFAVLRSMGLSPRGMKRMLRLEGLYFGLLPSLLSIPILAGVCGIMLHYAIAATWKDFLAGIPWLQLAGCFILAAGSVGLAYQITGAKIRQENVIDAIKDENL
ncbi:ABC transporter permease [Paenibacillus sp. FSL L8-0340]|uniref:ABC transporter permease n=1 Tax=Paenibacillus sp. FSL L8-0340 TaxID=2954685 RepID=UPI0031593CFC